MTIITLSALLVLTAALYGRTAGRAWADDVNQLQRIREHRAATMELRDRKCLKPFKVYGAASLVPVSRRPLVAERWKSRRVDAMFAGQHCGPKNWLGAVRWVQAYFPGTSSWLLSCSGSEGGHLGYIYNRQGSRAQGWLQFMPGTFYGFMPAAMEALERRGVKVRAEWRSIFSPVGQAVTGAHMYLRGLSRHWVGNGC